MNWADGYGSCPYSNGSGRTLPPLERYDPDTLLNGRGCTRYAFKAYMLTKMAGMRMLQTIRFLERKRPCPAPP
jgi:hypothetical protein